MNFYKHHLGDYDGATAHLDWLEDMAYTRLLRAYYRRELPIPLDHKDACRLVRANSAGQKAAVSTVLGEFFEQQTDGWHNKRADEEIAAYQAQASTNRRIAQQRSVKRIVPRSADESDNETSHGSSTKGSPNQEPRTKNHKPEGSTITGWWKSDKGIEATAKTLGLKVGPLETYPELKARCFSEIERRKTGQDSPGLPSEDQQREAA